jgi:hypothetical protein
MLLLWVSDFNSFTVLSLARLGFLLQNASLSH